MFYLKIVLNYFNVHLRGKRRNLMSCKLLILCVTEQTEVEKHEKRFLADDCLSIHQKKDI